MLGNLQVFAGPEKINAYAALLKSNPALLWTARTVLIVAVILHIIVAYQLARISQRSRPLGYKRWRAVGSDLASRTMRWTGPIVGLFIIYHLLHFTTGTLHPAFNERDVYHNVISGFQVWYVSIIYIVAMLALSLHLYHGAWSSVRTLGAAGARPHPLHRPVAMVLAVALWLGFSLVPIAIALGWVR